MPDPQRPADRNIPQRLATPVQYLRGVGPARVEQLAKLGLHRASDVLFGFPRDYQDLTEIRTIAQLEPNRELTIRGAVEEVELRQTGAGRTILGVLIGRDAQYVRALWFNQPFLRERFQHGQELLVTGTAKRTGLVWEMHHPRIQWLEADAETPRGRMLPIYRLTEGLAQRQMRQIVRAALDQFADMLDEVFPPDFLESHGLWPIRRAIEEIHFPTDPAGLDAARRRFIYQDLFVMQLALALKRHQQAVPQSAPSIPATAKIDARIRRLIPFELTADQQQAISEVALDLGRDRPMNRLLQGDVGSGKTVVALYGILTAVAHGYQAALMSPTEILARQHYATLEKLLAGSQVRRALLVGGAPAAERTKLIAALAAGELDLLVGTQALLAEDVKFAKLGLAVIDEQHKFGVRQRAGLKNSAGTSPHYLVMTATPIPRTIGMTLFGDLDVSTLRQAPPGRQPVHTYLASPSERDRWWEFYKKKLRSGRQGYVIAPLVEQSEATGAASAEEMFEALSNGPLEEFRLGLIHGRMSTEAQRHVMEEFRSGKLQVLVATSVVEVGVDVANATLMTIEDGERFGLSALHQLRGRICRGSFQGFCCVFGNLDAPAARERLEAFTKTFDGFELAEIDFKQRGPGSILGTEQSGLAPLRFADLSRDTDLLTEARIDALALTAADPHLADPRFEKLKTMVLRRYGASLDLADVG